MYLWEEENSSGRNSQEAEVGGEIGTERDERKKSVVMFSLASNNAETILEVAEDDEGEALELLDLENKAGSRKVSGTSGSGNCGSGSSRGRRASIFSAFSNFTMNHRPSCFSRLSEVSPTFSMVSFYDWNYRNLFLGILTVLIMIVVILYFFIIFVPNLYFPKFPGNDKFNHLWNPM